MHDDVSRVTIWLQTQLPDHEIRVGEETDSVTWSLSADDGAPPSKLRIPLDYFERTDVTAEVLLDALEREAFPELVEAEDGICRTVSRDELNPGEELVLKEC